MELSQLRQIVAVADAQSFSRAAEHLSITQPALSRSVAAFEGQYGMRLFDRGRRGAACTPAGRLVVEQARELLAASKAMETGIQALARGTAGEIVIGMGPLVSNVTLSRLVLDLLESGVAVNLTSIILVPERLLVELLSDRLEMFFGSPWQSESPDIVKTYVGRITVSLLVRADHPLTHCSTVTMADLKGFPIVNSVSRLSGYLLGTESPGLTCDNHHILRAVALASDSLWFTAPNFAREDLEVGRVVAVKLQDFEIPQSDIYMFRRRGRPLSATAYLIQEHVARILSG